jgi:hypothetical protein
MRRDGAWDARLRAMEEPMDSSEMLVMRTGGVVSARGVKS